MKARVTQPMQTIVIRTGPRAGTTIKVRHKRRVTAVRLDNATREAQYLRLTKTLTPRQRRRIKHKEIHPST